MGRLNLNRALNIWVFIASTTLFFSSVNGTSTASAVEKAQRFTSGIENKIERMGLKKSHVIYQSKASWYGGYFHGRTTANMETFDKNVITAAHKTLPLNTFLLVTNINNGKKIVVRVNDRGPYVKGRDIDLSEAAAKHLGSRGKGVVPITYEVLERA